MGNLQCPPSEGAFVSTFPNYEEGCGLKTDNGLSHRNVKKVAFLAHLSFFVCFFRMRLGSLHLFFQNGLSEEARAGDSLSSDSPSVSR